MEESESLNGASGCYCDRASRWLPVRGHEELGGVPRLAEQVCAWRGVAICYRFNMSQPVKLSDSLVLDARIAGESWERSIAGQVEFWARLGRSLELLLGGQQVLALSRAGAVRPLSASLESVDSAEGRERVAAYLDSRPFPHFEPHPDRPGLLVRIDADGTRTAGRFRNRQFQPDSKKSSRR